MRPSPAGIVDQHSAIITQWMLGVVMAHFSVDMTLTDLYLMIVCGGTGKKQGNIPVTSQVTRSTPQLLFGFVIILFNGRDYNFCSKKFNEKSRQAVVICAV